MAYRIFQSSQLNTRLVLNARKFAKNRHLPSASGLLSSSSPVNNNNNNNNIKVPITKIKNKKSSKTIVVVQNDFIGGKNIWRVRQLPPCDTPSVATPAVWNVFSLIWKYIKSEADDKKENDNKIIVYLRQLFPGSTSYAFVFVVRWSETWK